MSMLFLVLLLIASMLTIAFVPIPAKLRNTEVENRFKFENRQTTVNLLSSGRGGRICGFGILTFTDPKNDIKWIRKVTYDFDNGHWTFGWGHGEIRADNIISDLHIKINLRELVICYFENKNKIHEDKRRAEDEARKREIIEKATLYEGPVNKEDDDSKTGQLAIVDNTIEGALSLHSKQEKK